MGSTQVQLINHTITQTEKHLTMLKKFLIPVGKLAFIAVMAFVLCLITLGLQ